LYVSINAVLSNTLLAGVCLFTPGVDFPSVVLGMIVLDGAVILLFTMVSKHLNLFSPGAIEGQLSVYASLATQRQPTDDVTCGDHGHR